MATQIISFRIAKDATYADRHASVMDAIKAEANGGFTWDETTSLVVLNSTKTADSLASSIYLGSSFSTKKDTLLVVNASNCTYATRGEVKYPATLDRLFPSNTLERALLG